MIYAIALICVAVAAVGAYGLLGWDTAFKESLARQVGLIIILSLVLGGLSLLLAFSLSVVRRAFGQAEENFGKLKKLSTDSLDQRRLLEASIARANAANRAKAQFLTNMSHEIRTPINGIMGMNYLLLESDLNEDQKTYAEMVQASSAHLLAIINDILDLSLLESDEVEMVMEPFDLNDLIEISLGAVRNDARQKGLALESDILFPNHAFFEGDIDRVSRVLVNILDNAIKFTDQGKITLSATRWNRGIVFNISDTGRGVPPQELPHLFERFYQVDSSTTRTEQGTGLGLSICREYIDLMGGAISIQSIVDQGTTFCISVPLTPVADRRNCSAPGDRRQSRSELPSAQSA